MSDYRIVCVNTEHPHRHITRVGTGDGPARASQMWTVAEVRKALADGDTFHTISPSTGRRATVYRDDCKIGGSDVEELCPGRAGARCRAQTVAAEDAPDRRRTDPDAKLAELALDNTQPQLRFSRPRRTISSTSSALIAGRPGPRRRRHARHFRCPASLCQRSSVPGVTRKARHRYRGSNRLRQPGRHGRLVGTWLGDGAGARARAPGGGGQPGRCPCLRRCDGTRQ